MQTLMRPLRPPSVMSSWIDRVIRGPLLVVTAALAMEQLGPNPTLLTDALTKQLTVVVGELALAFGLGGPGVTRKVLFYCLPVGSAMGGNGSLVGASANMVTAGIAEGAGYPSVMSTFSRRAFLHYWSR